MNYRVTYTLRVYGAPTQSRPSHSFPLAEDQLAEQRVVPHIECVQALQDSVLLMAADKRREVGVGTWFGRGVVQAGQARGTCRSYPEIMKNNCMVNVFRKLL